MFHMAAEFGSTIRFLSRESVVVLSMLMLLLLLLGFVIVIDLPWYIMRCGFCC